MIRSVLLAVVLALPPAFAADGPRVPQAQPPPEGKLAPKQEDTSIERYRTPFQVLSESTIGLASRAVLFDWRKSTVAAGLTTGALLELNNFYSTRLGGFVRMPVGNLTAELAVTRVFTWGSDSSEKLSLTPYRQSGRPSRIELEVNLAYALLEGVGTPRLGLLPSAELVFSIDVGFRYLYYPGALGKANAGQVVEAIFAAKISERELDYLERERLPGMQIDAGRYGLLAGFALDLYFRTGIFLEPKVMLAIPVLSGLSGSRLGWWWELSMALGVSL